MVDVVDDDIVIESEVGVVVIIDGGGRESEMIGRIEGNGRGRGGIEGGRPGRAAR